MTDIDHARFEDEVARAGDNLAPARACLLLARECAYPDIRPSDYLIMLDDLATAAHAALSGHQSPHTRGLALAEFLFQAAGFQGNRRDYGDAGNSYLNQVLERRLGIPISLVIVYLEVGRRLRLPVRGVGMPGHFIARIEGEDGPTFIDPFNAGRTLTLDDCADLVRASAGLQGGFDTAWLAPASGREIMVRVLNNLRLIYAQLEDWPLAIKIAERLMVLQPGRTQHLRDLGVLHYRNGAYGKASTLLSEYLAREPGADDVESVRQGRDLLLDELARLN